MTNSFPLCLRVSGETSVPPALQQRICQMLREKKNQRLKHFFDKKKKQYDPLSHNYINSIFVCVAAGTLTQTKPECDEKRCNPANKTNALAYLKRFRGVFVTNTSP